MTPLARLLSLGSVVLLGLGLLTCGSTARGFDDEDDIRQAQKDLLDLAKTIEMGKDGTARVQAMRRKYEDLAPIMHAFKPSPKGGLGYDGAVKGPGDGIELKVITLSKKVLTPEALAREKTTLVKLAYFTAAVADVASEYAIDVPPGAW